MIELDVINKTPTAKEPFPYFIAQRVITPENMKAVSADFPNIIKPGVFYISDLTYGEAFRKLIESIKSKELAKIVGDKLGIDLTGKRLMVSVRGQSWHRDGRIHNDSKDKIATCLLYLNDKNWDAAGGRLRLLKNDHDIHAVVAEVSPEAGNLLAFKRTENSWHGHEHYEGQRRSIMFNWLSSDFTFAKNVARHKFSAVAKRLGFRAKSDY